MILLLFTQTCLAVSPQSKQNFINELVPKIEKANAIIQSQRNSLLGLYQYWQQKGTLPKLSIQWIQQLATRYKLKNFKVNQKVSWQNLLKRVDIVPTSMVVAQAANESAWGTSRFAKQALNYFGQWCYRQGCGLVPRQRAAGAKFEVKKFPSIFASIQAYLRNLNTHYSYKDFRQMRYQLRVAKKSLDPLLLITGLEAYSQRRKAYVKTIASIINSYQLQRFDSQTSV